MRIKAPFRPMRSIFETPEDEHEPDVPKTLPVSRAAPLNRNVAKSFALPTAVYRHRLLRPSLATTLLLKPTLQKRWSFLQIY